ncbi:arylsulfatase domain protein, partial [Vibrio parahaemolyticus V-223/04]
NAFRSLLSPCEHVRGNY